MKQLSLSNSIVQPVKRNIHLPRERSTRHKSPEGPVSPPGPRRSPTLQFLSDLNVPLSVNPVDVITPPSASPRNTSRVVFLLRHIEYRADIVNLNARDNQFSRQDREKCFRKNDPRSAR